MYFRGLTLTLALACSLATASAQYKPAVGDYVEVIRKAFKPGKLAEAKRLMLDKIHHLHSRDKLVRHLIVGENRAANELVGLIVSDPYNRGNWSNKNAYPEIESILAKPPTRVEYRLFAVHDEGVKVQAGDSLRLYWHSIVPDKHQELRTALATRMMNALRKDAQKENGYFAESETAGEILGIGVGPKYKSLRPHAKHVAHIEPHRRSPIKIDELRVILVRHEGK